MDETLRETNRRNTVELVRCPPVELILLLPVNLALFGQVIELQIALQHVFECFKYINPAALSFR